jgi:hypothetical protein
VECYYDDNYINYKSMLFNKYLIDENVYDINNEEVRGILKRLEEI